MFIVHDAIFGFINMNVFQLTERIALETNGQKRDEKSKDRLRFSYLAIPSRHEVPCMSYL